MTDYHNNATASEASVVPAAFSGAGIATAAAHAVKVGPSPALALMASKGYTATAWIKINTAQPDAAVFAVTEAAKSFVLGVNGTKPYARIGTAVVNATVDLPVGEWHFLAASAVGGQVILYVDGADECDPHLRLIKGGGAALTREKIVAAAAQRFVCIVDDSKQVDVLGRFPLPVEVIPMARSYVGRQLLKLGGQPVWREGVITDNGNLIIDVHGLSIVDPVSLETRINQIAGVVTVGLFAHRPADVLIVGNADGVKILP